MKDCYKYKKYFSDYIEGNISETLKKQLLMHLEVCERCRLIVTEMIDAKKVLKSLAQVSTSPSFEVVLKSKIRREARIMDEKKWYSVFSSDSLRVPAFAFSAAALILFGIVIDRMVINADSQVMQSAPIVQEQTHNSTQPYASSSVIDSNNAVFTQVNQVQPSQSPQFLGFYENYHPLNSTAVNARNKIQIQPNLVQYNSSNQRTAPVSTLNYEEYVKRMRYTQSGMRQANNITLK